MLVKIEILGGPQGIFGRQTVYGGGRGPGFETLHAQNKWISQRFAKILKHFLIKKFRKFSGAQKPIPNL
jgi:hypothetical protein